MEALDVAVIGAGAAGLAVADELHRKGFSLAVFEARDRIGGRILTHRDARVPLPIELGPELIHGEAPETRRILREAGRLAIAVEGDSWEAESGRLRRSESPWKDIDRLLQKIDTSGPDLSFADFLARRPGGKSLAQARESVRRFVQGFHAADVEQISACSLAGSDSGEARDAGRVLGGYDQVPAWLARDLGDAIRLGCPVTGIDWEPGQVELTLGTGERVRARAAVVTVPLGILQAPPDAPGAIRFRPEVPRLSKTLGRLAMGSVLRLVFWFREAPWKVDRLGFLFTGDETFRTWWTAYPLLAPLAVCWSGGPPAAGLTGVPVDEIAGRALRTLATHLGLPRRRVESRVLDFWMHDWQTDPWSRGGYSYPRVGGAHAAQALARPIKKTLFFAGEATAGEGENGTVEGALASGQRVARQVSRAL
ncbi:MAG TPA: NAD(P)/FAD-dependent oxidoreductase [Thermoanaerobaculia bacterium]|nr:NAD(P)/FAD-dependent oxidoreductase [Thermoanaerobaculia bacterium]